MSPPLTLTRPVMSSADGINRLNVPSFNFGNLRSLLPGNENRFQCYDGFDLNLTYITSR